MPPIPRRAAILGALYPWRPLSAFALPEIVEETSQDWCGRCPPGTVTEADAICVGCSRPLCDSHDEGYNDGYEEHHACQGCAAIMSGSA